MLGFLVTFLLLGYGIALKKIRRNWFSPDTFYCLFWGLICFFASLRLYGLWGVSHFGWFLVIFGSSAFVLGAHFSYSFSVSKKNYEFYDSFPKGNFNETLFFVIVAVLYIHAIPEFLQSLRLLMKGINLAELRHAHFGNAQIDGFVRNSSGFSEIRGYFFSAMKTIVAASSINHYFKSCGKKRFIIPILGLISMQAFTDGGRFGFAYFFVMFFSCYFIYNDGGRRIQLFKNKKSFKMIAVVPFVMVVMISLMRGVVVEMLSIKYYRYFCGCLVFFDQHLQRKASSDFYSYSMSAFYGFWHQFLPFIHSFFGVDYPEIYSNTITFVMDTQLFIQIGDKMYTNAFITPFYHLFFDYRYVGVFAGMFLFGFVAQLFYKETLLPNDKRDKNIVLYLIFMQFIFSSLFQYPLISEINVDVIVLFLIVNLFRIRIV